MITKIIYFWAFVAVVTASCHVEPIDQRSEQNEQCCGSRGDLSLSGEAEILSETSPDQADEAVSQSAPGRIVSNDCNCVKTILRPTERRQIQIIKARPISQQIQYDCNPALYTRPTVSSNVAYDDAPIQTISNCLPFSLVRGIKNRETIEQYSSESLPQYPSCGNSLVGESYSGLDTTVPQVQEPRLPQPGQIISNNCNCVKTVLRHKPVTRVSVVPTERKVVQTFTKPVVRRFQYSFNPQLQTGPVPQVRIALQPIEQPRYAEFNAESIIPSGLDISGSQLENCEQDFINLSQLPSC